MRGRSLIAALGLLLLLGGCGRGGHAFAPAPHTLEIADLSNPNSLNPLLAHDQDTIAYDLLICQTLIGLDARNRLVPILVTKVPTRANGGISRDGLRITYHLRRGVRFADGVPLTSADVAFTYRAIMDPRNPVLSQDAYLRIASLSTPDPYTVVIRLKRPWNAAVSDLFAQSDFAFGILPAHAFANTDVVNAAWENHAFGSGPFRVVQWRRGDRVVLEPNPYFLPRPRLQRIVLRMIPDIDTAFVALQTGEVDVAPLYPDMLANARGEHGIRILETPENATVWLTLQMHDAPTSSLSVRRAVAEALNLAQIRESLHDVYPVAGSFLPPVLTRWYDPGVRPYPYDLAAARALLAGKRVRGSLVVQAGSIDVRTATIVQHDLAQAGIDVYVKPVAVALYNAPSGPVRNARFMLTIDGWLGGADPEQSIVFLCSQATVDGDNNGRFCNPRFEQLFADQQTTSSERRRRADFKAMQELIHDHLPIVPLYYQSFFDGVNARVRDFKRNMLRYPVDPQDWDASRPARAAGAARPTGAAER